MINSGPSTKIAKAPLLRVRGLKRHFLVSDGFFSRQPATVRAVDGVDFDLAAGETLGLVGESGCGKTTVGRLSLRLLEPTAGTIEFDNRDIARLDRREMNRLRPRMQMIFQDPFGSLNPRFTVERLIGEAALIHGLADKNTIKSYVDDLLRKVGLSPRYRNRYPHEFSGGQRQRIAIARALALKPDYIVCDEPVSALDVSIQAQIINLLKRLQAEHGMALLFISHDLNVVKHLSRRTAVMYLGRIVESAPTEVIHRAPAHPYTQALLSAKPTLNPRNRGNREVLAGDVPSPLAPPSGCHFHPRCPQATELCKTQAPKPFYMQNEHMVACHLQDQKEQPDPQTGDIPAE